MAQRLLIIWFCLSVLLTALSSVGCGGGGGAPVAREATVTGTVLDNAGLQPVNKAQVVADGDTTTTNAAGDFTLQTTEGAKTIRITRNGYQPLTLTRSLQAGSNAIGTQHLEPSLQAGNGAATGTVHRNGVAIAGAEVQSGGSQATTRADGSFAIYNLPAGERGLLALDPATNRLSFTAVNISAGQTTAGANINLNLEPPDEPDF